MRPSVRTVHDLVDGIRPHDELEVMHRRDTLSWLESTDDVFRRIKPATPPRHLVTYTVVLAVDDGSFLLCAHRNAGLWLPPGGHVEPDEHPAETARREAVEELGVELAFAGGAMPRFVTVTETVGVDHGHVDVSLWFVLLGWRGMPLAVDRSEFRSVRWWTPAEVRDEPGAPFDPHFRRFLGKLAMSPA